MGKLSDVDARLKAIMPKAGKSGSPDDCIAVVDDEPYVCETLVKLFQDRYTVQVFAEPDGIAAALQPTTLAMILDVKMQRHDGFWAYEQVRALWPSLPILFYSAYQDVMDPFQIINRYAPFGYIDKGGGIAELVDKVEEAVAYSRELTRQRQQMEATRK